MYRRTRAELVGALADQLAALASSCGGYDAGDMWEGPRIATAVYNIVNDGKSKTKSILTQLGIRSQMEFLSCAEPNDPQNILAWIPLITVAPDHTGSLNYIPDLGRPDIPKRMLRFGKWWNEAVFENRAKQALSRMNLTFALRSKDGGSHFDGELPISTYLELKSDGGTGFYKAKGKANTVALVIQGTPSPEEVEELPRTAHLATMRHIAWEVQESIRLYLESCGYDSVEQLA